MKTIAAWTTAFLILATLAFAVPPPKIISYQGYLKDGAGNPVSAATNLTFRLYSSASGVNPAWTESRNVSPANGVYSVGLGETSPLPDPFNRQYYLGVQAGGDPEMRPLQMLMAVPYALQAGCNPGDMMNCYTGPPGTLSPMGLCRSGVRTCSPDGASFGICAGESTPNCGSACLDLSSNVANCGACGNVCSYQNGSAVCNSSVCSLAACSTGYGNCDVNPSNGCETPLLYDSNNCGACGNSCSYPNAYGACNGGSCSLAYCTNGYGNCDGNPSNGCEINLMYDYNNCGGCGNSCFNYLNNMNANGSCNGGSCSATSCYTGFSSCGGNPNNGCWINLMNDSNNCGYCGHVCTKANPFSPTPYCSGGFCY